MSSNRSICLLNDSFPPVIDGVANAVVNYARIIERDLGHALVLTPDVREADDSQYDFSVVRYPSIDTRKLIGYVTGYPFSPEAARKVQEDNVSLLHVHCPATSCLLARQLSESMDLPLILTWHTKYDIDIANAVKSKALQEGALAALLRNVNACDEIWTVSHGAGENLRSLGYEGDYIVMPNGVDLPRETASSDLVDAVTGGYDLPSDVPCYLFIGRLMWYKGLKIIIDALAMMSSHGLDFRMVFVGGGGDEAEVRSYAAQAGLGSKVIFTGVISDRDKLRAWYTRADLFLFPSTFDTNGLVVREAAASDTAAVIIRDSCASEGVTDDRNGFLIDENAASLAAKLEELLPDKEACKRAGRAAGDELYISWDDAVTNAYGRYEVVADRYRSGKYKAHDPLRGSWMQSQGELMQILGDVEAAGRSIRRRIEEKQEEFDMSMRSIRNHALTEAISAGYQTRQQIESRTRETLSAIESAVNETKDSIELALDDIWGQLERYL